MMRGCYCEGELVFFDAKDLLYSQDLGGCWVLKDDHGELTIGRNHNFVHRGTNFDKSDVFFWVQRLNGTASFVHEIIDQCSIVNSIVLSHGTLDGDTFFIDNDDTKNTHMSVDAI